MARRASQKRRHELNNIRQRQNNVPPCDIEAREAINAALVNAIDPVDVSALGFVKNWQECTAVAVNPHTGKSWNSYANVANERLKDVEYNRNIQRESPRKGSNAAKLRVGDASNYFQPLAQKVTK